MTLGLEHLEQLVDETLALDAKPTTGLDTAGKVTQLRAVAPQLARSVTELLADLRRERERNVDLQGSYDDVLDEIARHHKDFARWEEMADKGAARIEENERLRVANDELVEALRPFGETKVNVDDPYTNLLLVSVHDLAHAAEVLLRHGEEA